jgi:hypothetical protein
LSYDPIAAPSRLDSGASASHLSVAAIPGAGFIVFEECRLGFILLGVDDAAAKQMIFGSSSGFCLLIFFCLTVISSTALPAGQAQSGGLAAQTRDFRVGIKVELVSLFATVHDRKGRLVTGLGQDDFVIFDNDAAQPISQFSREYMPLSIVILLDTSSSMAGMKLDNAKRSLTHLLNRLCPGDEVMLMSFNSRPLVIQKFTMDMDRIRRSIRGLNGDGSTALYDAILLGLKESEQAHNRRRVLLLLSDGINTYGRAELKGTISQLRLSAAELFAIGLETDLLEELQYKAITETVLDQLTGSAG